MEDWLLSSSEPDYIHDVNTQQPGDDTVLHRRAGTGYESDDEDGSTNDTSSVYSTSSSSGVSYSEESGDLREKPDQSSSSDTDDALPATFRKGPFLYNGRTLLVSIPGLLLVFAVGGETLLTVITCGGLMTQLCLRSGNKSRSLVAYVVAFIAVQIVVLYSVLPLLWKSLYTYLVIVPTINMFSAMTGAWFLLSFDNFVCHEYELAQCIEVLLFTLYPVLCVVCLTWLSVTLIPVVYTPYVLIITGFAILQFYLIPAPSSYRKPVPQSKDHCNVLDPVYPACFALFFCFTPLSVFLVIIAALDVGQTLLVVTAVECFFLTSLSIFLATFFNLREFLDGGGLSYHCITITRQCCGYASVLAFCQLLYCRDVLSHLLPWLPVAIILHMIIGALWSYRKKRMYLQIVTAVLCLYYILLFCELPWMLDYYIVDGQLAIGVVFALLLTNCLLTVACVYVSLYHTTETFGSFLLIQTLGFVLLEMLLLSSGLYSLLLTACVTTLLIYVVLRLHHSKKLLWQPTLAIASVHLTALWNAVNIVYPTMQQEVSTSHISDLFDFLAAWLLIAILCGMYLVASTEILDKSRTQMFIVSSLVMSLLAARAFVPKLVWLIAGRKEPCLADVLAFSSAVVCLISMKMDFCHRSLWRANRYIWPVSLMLAILLLTLQPTCQLTSGAILKWLLHGSAVCALLVVARATTLNSMTRLHIASIVIGVPVGLEIADLLFDDTASIYVHLLYSLLTTVCVELALATWTPVRHMETIITSGLSVLLVTSVVLSIMDQFTKSTAQVGGHYWPPGMLGRAGFSLVAAAILKTTSFLEESEFLTAHGSILKSKLPILGNILTAVAFSSVCHLQPLVHWEPWVMMCSCITFLFQRDPVLLRSLQRTNQITLPVVVATATVMGSSIYGCHIWSSQLYPLTFFLHLFELCLIFVQSPVLLVFLNILWNGEFYINERFVVFLMPLASILLVIGSSYITVVFGLYTLLVGMWLMVYKLPLAVNETDED